MAAERTGRFNLAMNRDAGATEIADLVDRAERMKRNREIILRGVMAPFAAPIGMRSTAFSPARELETYLSALRPPSAADAEPLP